MIKRARKFLGPAASLVASTVIAATCLASTPPPAPHPPASQRDGSHDFDFEVGEWTTQLKRLQKPLSGSTTWLEYRGTTTVRPLLSGRANIAELVVEGDAGRIEGAALRLYDPEARQWSLNYFNIADGHLTTPVIGEFLDGRGVFFAQDTYRGRAIFVRFVITKVDDDTYRFEQAFSADGGAHWELNWVATDRRRR